MKRDLRILHCASEMLPFVKTGGLADVVGALPAALARQGLDVRVAIPGYRRALQEAERRGVSWGQGAMIIEVGGVDHHVGVGTVTLDGVQVHLLACNELFDRDGVYGPNSSNDYDDNCRRFSVFAKACLALPGFVKWKPHVVHAHDWQAGLIPALLERGFQRDLPGARSVFSIHNIAYQGAFWHFDMKLTGLDWSLFNPMHCEHYGKLNLLKTGVVFADRVTTVSRRYAEEIQTPEHGYGLDAVMKGHAYKLVGHHQWHRPARLGPRLRSRDRGHATRPRTPRARRAASRPCARNSPSRAMATPAWWRWSAAWSSRRASTW